MDSAQILDKKIYITDAPEMAELVCVMAVPPAVSICDVEDAKPGSKMIQKLASTLILLDLNVAGMDVGECAASSKRIFQRICHRDAPGEII